ncbi:MAG: hypothetical protein JW912_05005 [Sedimentisphaerales bacterium]|nr:hypothetical protein [Sedimentisphaerales bacterium]
MRLINKNFSGSKVRAIIITLYACWIILTASVAYAIEDQSFSVFRNRLYKLKHISATDAGMFLVDLKIGNQIMVMSDNSMMISSDVPSDLVKASNILELIDSQEPFVLRTIAQISDFQTIPSSEQIEEKIPYMSIGTFKAAPSDDSKPKAIVDVHGTDLIAIAGPDYIQNIKETIAILQYPDRPMPEKPSIEEELYAAKKELEELKKQVAQPAAPTIGYVSEDLLLEELSKDQQQMNTYENNETITPQPQLVFQSDSTVQDPSPNLVSQDIRIGDDDSSLDQPIEPQQQPEQTTEPEQQPEELAPEIPEAEKELELTLTLPEKVEILSLLELVGKQLGLNYIYDPKEIKGEVMLKVHDGKIKVKDTYALLESVMKFMGFVMTRRGNLVTIVPNAKALEFDPVLRTDAEDIQPGDVIATTVFELENISTKSAQDLLTSMKLGTTFNAIPETGTLIVTEYAYRMKRIEKILKLVDVPGKPLNIRLRQINFIVADELAPKLKTLAEKLGTVSISVSAPDPKTPATPARTARTARTPARTTPQAAQTIPQDEGVYLEVDERTNRILMIGTEEELDVVDSLVDILDIQKKDFRTIREYEIQHVDPIVILETLNEIGIISTGPEKSTRSARSRTTAAAKPATAAATPTAPASGDQNPLTEEPQISILEATHSMLINATPEQHEAIAKIIAHVDRRLDRGSTPYVVYQLENQDPVELEEILTKLIEKTKVEAIKSTDPKAQTKTTSTSQSDEDIYIIADPATYSLIVYADKKNQQWISDIIKELDKYRSQVLLDVTLVEISKDDEFKFDLDIISRRGGFSPGGSLDSGKISSNLTNTDRWGADILEAGFKSAAETASFTAFYADSHIQALLETVDKKGYGRVLARPSILVKDNEEGKIGTTETIYVAEQKSNVVSSTTGNPVTSTDVSFTSYDSGIDLLITPHITSKDLLQLAIELKRKDFKDRTDNSVEFTDTDTNGTPTKKVVPKPLDTVESNVTTVATIPDGATIILGGIEKISQNKAVSKVPFFGDIPIVGLLFRGISDSDIQTRLYVFVKAHIIEPSDALTGYSDIEKISQEKRRHYEEAEARFQSLQSIPGVDPDPMDPLRILEDDDPIN